MVPVPSLGPRLHMLETLADILIASYAGFLVTVTLMPLLPTEAWWARICSFPRWQLAAGAGIGLVLAALFATHDADVFPVLLGLFALVGLFHAAFVLPFTPLFPKRCPKAPPDAPTAVHVTVANVDFENTRFDETVRKFEEHDGDLLLVIEVNAAWARALEPLRRIYPHFLEEVREEGVGIALYSRLEILESEVVHLVSRDRPAIRARVRMRDGRECEFWGIHPAPPGLRINGTEERMDADERDGEYERLAERLGGCLEPTIVAGDFNDAAWTRSTRRFLKKAGLGDPRVGRGLYCTYHADWPLTRFPIDHVLCSRGFAVKRMEVLPSTGSDHFAFGLEAAWVEDLAPERRGQ